MTPQEAQQSQAIAKIRAGFGIAYEVGDSETLAEFVSALLAIVDFKAQKIAELTKDRDEMTATAYRLGSEAQQHISEARKLAEKMRDASERPGGGHTFLPWERKP